MSAVLIGERYRPALAQSLAAQEIEAFWVPDDAALDPRLAGHADLVVFCAGMRIFAAEEIYNYIVSYLTNRGYLVEPVTGLGKNYPADVPLCICATGKYTIYNPATAYAPAVAAAGGIPVHVNQGYTRCAVLVVDDASIIMGDAGVCRAAKSAGMDTLYIEPGYVTLDGYDTGFIGGASFTIGDTVYFTGTLDSHPDRERILRFITEHGKRPVFLTDRPIFDIGGAIPV